MSEVRRVVEMSKAKERCVCRVCPAVLLMILVLLTGASSYAAAASSGNPGPPDWLKGIFESPYFYPLLIVLVVVLVLVVLAAFAALGAIMLSKGKLVVADSASVVALAGAGAIDRKRRVCVSRVTHDRLPERLLAEHWKEVEAFYPDAQDIFEARSIMEEKGLSEEAAFGLLLARRKGIKRYVTSEAVPGPFEGVEVLGVGDFLAKA